MLLLTKRVRQISTSAFPVQHAMPMLPARTPSGRTSAPATPALPATDSRVLISMSVLGSVARPMQTVPTRWAVIPVGAATASLLKAPPAH